VQARDALVKAALRVLPYKFMRHHVYPLLVRGRQTAYDPESYWESRYQSAEDESGISDGHTVGFGAGPLTTAYHYNVVENHILSFLIEHRIRTDGLRVLDVGSGAGHWIRLYDGLPGTQRIDAIEISATSVEALRRSFQDSEGRIRVRQQDVAAEAADLGGPYDLVNAIGVMFHIVNDERWERAVHNLAACLAPGGHLLIGGQFGRVTRNVQFHDRDRFPVGTEPTSYVSLGELLRLRRSDEVRVNKRIRSLPRWKRCAGRAGLEFVRLYRSRCPRRMILPENNLLALRLAEPREGGLTA
jgi:SAM-dependent methyltransferase